MEYLTAIPGQKAVSTVQSRLTAHPGLHEAEAMRMGGWEATARRVAVLAVKNGRAKDFRVCRRSYVMNESWWQDGRLVESMLGGDEAAFSHFFASYYRPLFRFAWLRLDRDVEAAEDVVQITLTRAIDKLPSYRGEAALLTWLLGFCRFEIKNWYRKSQRQPRATALCEERSDVRTALEAMADGSSRPEEALRRKEVARVVRATLDDLPRHYGHALQWMYMEGLSVGDIARRLGRTVKATESTLTRARVAFRDGFRRLLGAPSDWELPIRFDDLPEK